MEPHPPGTTFLDGKLEVVKLLGAGGMGAVYLVTHRLTRHQRALKILHPEFAQNADVVARFLREASVAGTLRTPHVVETFDAGQMPDGAPYVLMEVLEGEALSDALARGLPSDRVARIVAGVCEGLTVAHDAGIVHRDLKPDNIFLTRDDAGAERVKILDFGISKFSSTHDFAGHLTRDGAMMGTPYYMSPEQAGGAKDVDARSDVYSLGVVLYEALAGRPPFVAESFPALIVMIHDGRFEPLERAAPNVDPALAAVVHRAMARDREARFPSAAALRQALLPFTGLAEPHVFAETLPSLPPPSTTASPATPAASPTSTPRDGLDDTTAGSRARSPVLLGATLLVALLALAAVLVFGSSASDDAPENGLAPALVPAGGEALASDAGASPERVSHDAASAEVAPMQPTSPEVVTPASASPGPPSSSDRSSPDPSLTDPSLTDPSLTDPSLTDPSLTEARSTGRERAASAPPDAVDRRARPAGRAPVEERQSTPMSRAGPVIDRDNPFEVP